jgi:hypothetical protein
MGNATAMMVQPLSILMAPQNGFSMASAIVSMDQLSKSMMAQRSGGLTIVATAWMDQQSNGQEVPKNGGSIIGFIVSMVQPLNKATRNIGSLMGSAIVSMDPRSNILMALRNGGSMESDIGLTVLLLNLTTVTASGGLTVGDIDLMGQQSNAATSTSGGSPTKS